MRRYLSFILFGLLISGSAHAANFALQSHRAIYDLRLQRAQDGYGISQLKGRLVLEWSEDCEGFILNQRMLTQVTDPRGEQVINDFRITSWESRDGLKFRYSSRNEIDGNVVEEINGNASREGKGQGGFARFTKPKTQEFDLPVNVVFPTEQMVLLLSAANAGERTRSILLFDGSRIDSVFETFSVIGTALAPLSAEPGGRLETLAGQRSWPVQLAYFPIKPNPDLPPGTPEFEIGFRLFQNGVATDLVIDYGDFALSGMLAQLENLPRPSC